MGTLFFHFAKKQNVVKISIFSNQKKQISATRWTGNKLFFKGGLMLTRSPVGQVSPIMSHILTSGKDSPNTNDLDTN